MRIVDLRRDTITLPDDEMRSRAFNAPLGDSVYGEDPKQRELEAYAALKTGKDYAIFVPSGTMGNLISVLSHTRRGEEIILEENAHIRTSETGGAGCVGGLMIKTVRGEGGVPEPEALELSIRQDDIHYPKTSLICLEIPHHSYGGIVPPMKKISQIKGVAEKHNIPVHIDGARIFNAAVYLNIDVREITAYTDSVMISLSKGLGAPVGSVVCGSEEFIKKANRYRKMLGGGMRQTGWLCACGLVALSDNNIRRLKEDHDNARVLAEYLKKVPGFHIDLNRIHTNYVPVSFDDAGIDAQSFLSSLKKRGILAVQTGESAVRFVTSRQVSRDGILYTIKSIEEILTQS